MNNGSVDMTSITSTIQPLVDYDKLVAELIESRSPNNSHSLLSVMDSTEWAIMPEKLEQLYMVVQQHIAGTNIQIQPDSSKMYSTSGVAVIPMVGTLTKRAYGLSAMSGVRTMGKIRADIQEAIDNPDISAIVLDIDSPGGTVDGTKELADFIAEAKHSKPIVAYANGLAASAAYWVASAATSIVAFDTSKVGSIGVIVKHSEHSVAAERAGIKETYIYKGKYKATGNPSEPLDAVGKAHIQAGVDACYAMFVDAISISRGISTEKLISDIATGECFLAASALELNLIDSIGALPDAILLAKQQGEKKMDEKATAETLEELQAQMATMTANMATLQTENATLQSTIESKEQAEAAKAHLELVAEQFSSCQISTESLEAFATLDEATLAIVCSEIQTRQEKITTLMANVSTESIDEDSTTLHDDTSAVTSIDQAVDAIMKRDDCDVDTATDTAQVEFAALFARD